MSTITLDDVKVVATSVANRNPGVSHVVKLGGETCRYTYPDGSHCFVGAVAEALALPLPSINSVQNTLGVHDFANWVERNSGKSFTDDAVDYLADAQSIADEGYYWPDVVAQVEV